jgi:hypothetical protein
MNDEVIAYDKNDLRNVIRAFKAMEDQAIQEAKVSSNSLATYLQGKIQAKSRTLQSSKVASRIADGSRVSKSSKVGEIGFGYVSQKFSGGANTQTLWGGSEFGSNRYKQFPVWSGRQGRGSRGWFIYPTLRAEQPHIINEWENAFSKIAKEW